MFKTHLWKLSLLGAALCLGSAQSALANSDAYPQKPITVIVSYAPGGTADITTRIVSEALSKELNVPFIVENKPGGSGSIGVTRAARAHADGYTLLSASSEVSLAATGKTALPFEVTEQLVPLMRTSKAPIVLVANAKNDHSLPKWKGLAKQKAESVTYATPGVMTPMHLVMTQIAEQGDFPVFHIPYNSGGRALTDLLGEEVDLLAVALGTVISQINAGTVVPLALLSSERSDLLSNTPTISEALDQDFGEIPATWFGWFMHKDTDPEIQEKIASSLAVVLQKEQVKKQLLNAGLEPAPLESKAFNEELIKEQIYYKKASDSVEIGS